MSTSLLSQTVPFIPPSTTSCWTIRVYYKDRWFDGAVVLDELRAHILAEAAHQRSGFPVAVIDSDGQTVIQLPSSVDE